MTEPYICIIEDHKGIRELYSVVAGDLSLKLFESAPSIDILLASKGIITDGDLPGKSGHRIAKDCREQGYKGLIFLVTARLQENERSAQYFTESFEKPISVGRLSSLYLRIMNSNL